LQQFVSGKLPNIDNGWYNRKEKRRHSHSTNCELTSSNKTLHSSHPQSVLMAGQMPVAIAAQILSAFSLMESNASVTHVTQESIFWTHAATRSSSSGHITAWVGAGVGDEVDPQFSVHKLVDAQL
jgi:hypothetical protein